MITAGATFQTRAHKPNEFALDFVADPFGAPIEVDLPERARQRFGQLGAEIQRIWAAGDLRVEHGCVAGQRVTDVGSRRMSMDPRKLTSAEAKRGAPALWTLLNAVFHADWRDDFDSARKALEADLSRYRNPDRQLLHEEAAELLANDVTDSQAEHFLELSGADLWIESELHMSGRAFARLIFDLTEDAA